MKKIICIFLTAIMMFSCVEVSALYKPTNAFLATKDRGWEFVEDNDTVYYADGKGGVQIADISDKNDAEVLSIIDTEFDTRTVEVYKKTLYAFGNSTMKVYNVANPKEPIFIGKYSTGGTTRSNIDGNRLGVFGYKTSDVYDLSVPAVPQKYATVSGYGNCNSGWLDGDYIYIVNTKNELYVYDITDPKEPVTAYTGALPKTTDSYYVIVEDNYLYIAHANGITVMDISDPTAPKITCEYESTGKRPQGIDIVGNTMYCVCYNNPMQIIDITDKSDLKLIESVGGMPTIAYTVKAIPDYILYAGSGGFGIIDTNYEIDMTKVPKVPTEEEVFGSDDNTQKETIVYEDTAAHWAKEAISEMSAAGYVRGVGDNLFAPEKKITRAEMLAVAVRMITPAIERYKFRFGDVSENDWYADYAETAYNLQIIPDEMISDGNLYPNREITREEMTAVTVKLAEVLSVSVSNGGEYKFEDDAEISDWAKDSVYAAVSIGLVSGVGDDKFSPKASSTRAQVSKILFELSKKTGAEDAEFIAQKYDVEKNIPQSYKAPYVKEKQEDGVPVVINVTDAVMPGELLSFHGEYLNDAEVYLQEGTENELKENATKLETVNSDSAGQSLTVQVPKTMKAGAYTAFIKNNTGISAPIPVNHSRFLWMDQEEIDYDGVLGLYGKNFTAEEFGGEARTSVAFVNGNDVYYPEITSITPYEIKVKVGASIPVGTYDVVVSNDGERWNKCEEAWNGVIEVIGEVYDPYGLNQPWANQFVWDNKVDITAAPYYADNTGTKDMTAVIQKAIDDVHAAGGGIVYFPEGEYRYGPIKMDSKVVLMGDGMDKSTLIYDYKGDDAAKVQAVGTRSDGKKYGKMGFLNIGFNIDNSVNQLFPDAFFWVGEDWGDNINNGDLRTSEHIFFKGCKSVCSMIHKDNDGRGLGMVIVSKGHILFENNVFYGYAMGPASNWNSVYSHTINNNYTTTCGNLYVTATHTVIDKNTMTRYTELSADNTDMVQGIFMRGYCYVHNNIIRNTGKGTKNDGEVVCTEVYRAGSRMSGKVKEAGSDYVVVDPYKAENGEIIGDWSLSTAHGNTVEVVITAGKGLGQRRKIKSNSPDEYKIYLEQEWDIVPDETSMFMVSPMSYSSIIHDNYANSGKKGLWLYGDCYESVVAENNLVDCEGVFVYTCYKFGDTATAMGSERRINTSYFNSIVKNRTKGFAGCENDVCGIGLQVGMESNTCEHVIIYGSVIKDNYMYGADPVPVSKGIIGTEAPDINGIYAFVFIRSQMLDNFTAMKSTIIENNSVEEMDRGITVGISPLEDSRTKHAGSMSEDYTLRNNSFTNVGNEIDAYEANGLVIIDD